MTRRALRLQTVVLTTGMTLQALRFYVRTGQRETRETVIEFRVKPVCRIVTHFAIRAEARLCVSWLLSTVVVGLVTCNASAFSSGINSTGVTLSAICEHVRSCKRESR